jgi:hypothetical protein
MQTDINDFDIGQMIFDQLQEVFGALKEVPVKEFTRTSVGRAKRYVPGENAKVSFENITVTKIFDVEIRNIKDREQLDLSNSFVTLVMPDDKLPLPIFAVDVDVHKEKYAHVITDLIPLSKDPEYLRTYDEPLKELKEKYKDMPGLVLQTPPEMYKIFPAMKEFEAFSSSGKIYGNITVEHASRIMNLLEDYLNLYCSFVKESGATEVLKRQAIQNEAMETKQNFKQMIAKMDFSDDMPNRPTQ